MGLKKLSEKLANYNDRLKSGKVSKIKPDHVEKVLRKLRKKSAELEAEIAPGWRENSKWRAPRKSVRNGC